MKKVAVLTLHQEDKTAALAVQLGLPLLEEEKDSLYDFFLYYENNTLKLKQVNSDLSAAIWVDFVQGKAAYRYKHQGKGKLPISRACGIKHNARPSIIDATAGLGQDAFILAGLGCTVLCIEQHPVIAALLADGIFRANEGDLWLREIVQRMHLTQGHAETVLSENKADVIYLDPMYPHQQNRKLAKVKKAMQLFRSFPGTDSNEKSLLKAACSSAVDRVVVKRPDWAKAMAGSVPSYQVPAKNHRFDIYKTVL